MNNNVQMMPAVDMMRWTKKQNEKTVPSLKAILEIEGRSEVPPRQLKCPVGRITIDHS